MDVCVGTGIGKLQDIPCRSASAEAGQIEGEADGAERIKLRARPINQYVRSKPTRMMSRQTRGREEKWKSRYQNTRRRALIARTNGKQERSRAALCMRQRRRREARGMFFFLCLGSTNSACARAQHRGNYLNGGEDRSDNLRLGRMEQGIKADDLTEGDGGRGRKGKPVRGGSVRDWSR